MYGKEGLKTESYFTYRTNPQVFLLAICPDVSDVLVPYPSLIDISLHPSPVLAPLLAQPLPNIRQTRGFPTLRT